MDFIPVTLGAFVALLATAFGAALALLFQRIGRVAYSGMLAFSAGVMAFSSMELLGESRAVSPDWMVAAGAVAGIIALFAADKLLPHAHARMRGRELAASTKKAALLAGAVTLHNIPEGLAIASAFAGAPGLGWLVTASLALQDIPEGFMASAPLICYGVRHWKAVGIGLFSGVVEFLAAIIGFIFISQFAPIVPFALAFSAGAMLYIIFVELLPDALRRGLEQVATLSFVAGAAIAFAIASLFGF